MEISFLSIEDYMKLMLKRLSLGLITALFAVSLYTKITNRDGTVAAIASKNVPFPEIAYLVAVVALLYGVVTLNGYAWDVVDKQNAKYGTMTLIGFTAVATVLFHNVYADPSQKNHFLKNLSIIGGLLYIYKDL